MSKMPAKKKSCFQITSVTTAQVAASAAEDAESLDDPDESRTEDVSSELLDASRATDYGPEGVCERSSSDETLYDVGDAATPAAAAPGLPPDGPPAPAPPPARGAPPAPPAPAACGSRFRVIKLDHGSGEPYRRGRWTCTEFYERDADGGVLTRSADCIRHGGPSEPAAERDSGLGATGGSALGLPDAGPDAAPAAPPPAPEKASQGPGPLPAAGPPPALPGPAAAQRPPPFAYPQAPPAPGHLLPAQPCVQSEYLPPHVAASFAVGAGQNASSAGAPTAGGPPQPPEAAALGAPVAMPPAAAGAGVQPGAGPAGAAQPHSVPGPQLGGPLPAAPGVPNVPAAASAPSAPAAGVTAPNAPAPLAPAPPPSSRTPGGRSSSAGQHAAAPASLPQADPSQFQTQSQPVGGHADDTRRKSEPLPQPPLSLTADKPVVKAAAADALSNPLQLTPMNSLATSVFSIALPVDGDEDRNPSTAFYQAFHLNTFQESKSLWDSASGGGVVAIDNKIEQAMDLVKSHLMYAVREEVEVLKEQIKELVERNSLLERENALLKSLSNNDQLSQLPAQQASPGSTSQQQAVIAQPQPPQPPQQPNVSSA